MLYSEINLDNYESIFDAIMEMDTPKLKPHLIDVLDFPVDNSYLRIQDLVNYTNSVQDNKEVLLTVSRYSESIKRKLKIRKDNDYVIYSLVNVGTPDLDEKELYKFLVNSPSDSYLDMYAQILWEVKNYNK